MSSMARVRRARRVGQLPRFAALAILIGCGTLSGGSVQRQPAATLPDRLTDRAFWELVTRVSEPGGYFRIEDNFTSNETEVGQIFSMLRGSGVAGDVFLGVGPEQNYTYIAAIRPRMAFIIDIRRQAVMQHLMFKAMFELSRDRADFVSLLFSKPRPEGVGDSVSVEQLWSAFRAVRSDSGMAKATYARVLDLLTKTHGFDLDEQERAQLRHVFDAFQHYGPSITTRGPPGMRGGTFMTLTGFSVDTAGEARSFLSSAENFGIVKTLHDRNLIVPVSGDFAGPRTLRHRGLPARPSGRRSRVLRFQCGAVPLQRWRPRGVLCQRRHPPGRQRQRVHPSVHAASLVSRPRLAVGR